MRVLAYRHLDGSAKDVKDSVGISLAESVQKFSNGEVRPWTVAVELASVVDRKLGCLKVLRVEREENSLVTG